MNAHSLSARFPVVLAAVLIAAAHGAARAGEVHDLQRGLPLEVEDTSTARHRQMQLQASTRYELEHDGGDLLFIEPQLQYGFADNFHVEVTYPIVAGSGDRTGAGDVIVSGLYRFYDERSPGFGDDPLPSMAVQGEFELPTGINSDGLDFTLRYIATKTLTHDDAQDRLHLNVAWTHNTAAAGDERHNFFSAVLGYSRKLNDETAVVADIVREQDEQEGQDATILEAGVIRQLTENVTISGGLGFGLGEESPDFRATFGFQYSF